jgi:hypothetical protein
MQDSKEMSWAHDYAADHKSDADDAEVESNESVVRVVDKAAADADGWTQYRRWISKAPAPRGRRTGIDPTLYTWRGYRSWAEQVKRKWSDD